MDFDSDSSGFTRTDPVARVQIAELGRELMRATELVEQMRSERNRDREAIAFLMRCLMDRKLLGDEDRAWAASYLGAKSEGDLARAAARASRQVVGKLKCACGSVFDQVKGLAEQQCPWCGRTTRTPG
jgi:hypothetical protein